MMNSILPRQRAKEHEALAKKLAQAQQQIERDVRAKQQDLEHARARAAQVRASCDEAAAATSRIEAEIHLMNRIHDRECSTLERQLEQLADPRIDEFVTWLDQENAALLYKQREWGGLGPATVAKPRPQTIGGSNHDAIVAVTHSIVAARREALALKCKHLPDVGNALDQIRRSILTIDEAEAATRRAS